MSSFDSPSSSSLMASSLKNSRNSIWLDPVLAVRDADRWRVPSRRWSWSSRGSYSRTPRIVKPRRCLHFRASVTFGMAFPFPLVADVPLYLAPMAGVSESPFRRLCRQHGADVVVTEFLSAEGIRRENEATLHKLAFGPDERPIGVQIFGADPVAMGEAARFVSDVFQPEFIDINFGCPVKKVVKRNGGSGCLKDLSLVDSVIRSVAAGTHLPVTVKIRSGWSEEMRDPVTIALRCQDAGAKALALHPRTRTQMYSGSARWEEIAAVSAALEIPVIGNGDIKTAEDAVRMQRQTGCAAIMIARGSFGQPWIFDQTRALLEGKPKPEAPAIDRRF